MNKKFHIVGWFMFIIFTFIELITGDSDTARDWLIMTFMMNILVKLDELEESVF